MWKRRDPRSDVSSHHVRTMLSQSVAQCSQLTLQVAAGSYQSYDEGKFRNESDDLKENLPALFILYMIKYVQRQAKESNEEKHSVYGMLKADRFRRYPNTKMTGQMMC